MKSLTKMLLATAALALAAPAVEAQTVLNDNSGWTEFTWYSGIGTSIGNYTAVVTGRPQLFEIADGYNAGDEFEFSVDAGSEIPTSSSLYNPSVYSPLYYIGNNYSAAFQPDESAYFSHYALRLNPGTYFITGDVTATNFYDPCCGTAAVQLIDVPEPATWTLAFLGLGAMGGALRGRTRRLASV
jgi:hypothetical protein